MKKLKVLIIVGTRPEIIRLSRVIAKLDENCELTLAHTGQNYDYELNEIFFDDLKIRKPDYFLNSTLNSKSVANTIGNIITFVDDLIVDINPGAILLLGDTNSSLSAIAAKRRKIPIFHMEAGNRCFDMRVPEEINRRIVDHTADINLTYSAIAREYLLREGLPPDQIIKTGSPMYEVLNFYMPQIKASNVLQELNLTKEEYFVISIHREENIDADENFLKLVDILNVLSKDYKLPVIVSVHPRTQNKINEAGVEFNSLVKLLKPLGFHDYVNLQMNSKTVLSDSGTINEESSILNFPALNLREVHERPEGMEESAVMMVGLEIDRIHQGLEILKYQMRGSNRNINIVRDYNVNNVSEKILRIIQSYTDFVNRIVWKKS
ncbi:UDP-N-acetylglucosamine 2-epimerase (non-hydrolyzing) [Amylibacter sp.]|nr:UDP-N-acetylglucosamine 2-epimerase (non-hydrolyzing) [Amylibacter sp.]